MVDNQLIKFESTQIRRTWQDPEWWFVVEDVVQALIESKDAKQYIQRIKQRDTELGKGWVQIVRTLDVKTKGGIQQMNCANLQGCLRIVQSVASPKAEPFKRWLAQVGSQTLQESQTAYLIARGEKAIQLKASFKQLSGSAQDKGVTNLGQFHDANNKAFYGGLSTNEVKKRKDIPLKATLHSRISLDELSALDFARVLARRAVESIPDRNELQAYKVSSGAHTQVREDLLRYGGVPPEDLPAEPELEIARKRVENPNLVYCKTWLDEGERTLEVHLPDNMTPEKRQAFADVLKAHPGTDRVILHWEFNSISKEVSHGVAYSKELVKHIETIFNTDSPTQLRS